MNPLLKTHGTGSGAVGPGGPSKVPDYKTQVVIYLLQREHLHVGLCLGGFGFFFFKALSQQYNWYMHEAPRLAEAT